MIKESTLLYSQLTRFGHCYALNIFSPPRQFLASIEQFRDDWKPYNPRKLIPRTGLSITSLDGGLSGIPDLDSLREWNKARGTFLTENDISVPTPVYPFVEAYLKPFAPWVRRSHLIQLQTGGYFPPHRDNNSLSINSFRLFVPIENCNTPHLYFHLGTEVLRFETGRVYFIDTCLEHCLFAPTTAPVTFIVLNIEITQASVAKVIEYLMLT
jgi:hypothetical protein